MKRNYIADYEPNQTVDDLFLVRQKEIRPKKTGGEYLFTVLADKTGSLSAFMWDNVDTFRQRFEVDDFVHVLGVTKDYNRSLQITVHKIQRVDSSAVDLQDFIRCSPQNPDENLARLVGLIQTEVDEPHLRQLLQNIFTDPQVQKRFKQCPAAKSLHHAYIGGLLDHTLSVMQLSLPLCRHYPSLNRSLLLAGAALHDLGKIEELHWGKSIDYTDEGRLVGHITMEAIYLDRKIREVPDFRPGCGWNSCTWWSATTGNWSMALRSGPRAGGFGPVLPGRPGRQAPDLPGSHRPARRQRHLDDLQPASAALHLPTPAFAAAGSGDRRGVAPGLCRENRSDLHPPAPFPGRISPEEDAMNLLPMLKLMEKTELSAAALYRWFSDLFSQDEEAAFLFYRLSVEEDGHANLVRFIIRLAGKAQMDGTDIDMDSAEMEKAIEEMNHVQTLAKLSLKQAVQLSLNLENQVFEYHGRNAVIQALPTIGPLVFSLGRLDEAHMRALAEFARVRGFLPEASQS